MVKPVVIVLAAVILAGIILDGNDNAQGMQIPYPEVDVNIDGPTTLQATVTDEQNDSVTFTGTIQAVHLTVPQVIVNLSAAMDTNWGCNLNPNQLFLIDTHEHPFNVTVCVPRATLADTVGHLEVTATATGDGVDLTTSATATVTVAPYFRLSVVPDGPYREIRPGEGTSFNFKVQNRGNAADSYGFTIANDRDLKDAGWSVKLSNSTMSGVPLNQTIDISVTARSPQGWSWDPWINRATLILLNVSSLGARTNNMTVDRIVPIQVTVRGTNTPSLELITTFIIFTVVGITIIAIFRQHRKRRVMAPIKDEL